METLKIVENLDDRKKAVVNLVSSSVVTPYYSKSLSPVVTEPRVAASSLCFSRRFESTPASKRHRSVVPARSRTSVQSTQGGDSTPSAPTAWVPEFKEYTIDTV